MHTPILAAAPQELKQPFSAPSLLSLGSSNGFVVPRAVTLAPSDGHCSPGPSHCADSYESTTEDDEHVSRACSPSHSSSSLEEPAQLAVPAAAQPETVVYTVKWSEPAVPAVSARPGPRPCRVASGIALAKANAAAREAAKTKATPKLPSIHRKTRFSPEEDAALIQLVNSHAGGPLTCSDWGRFGATMGKSSKQCRERWCNVLNPKLDKSKFNDVELSVLMEAYERIGSRWSVIAAECFPNRSENAVKNAYYAAQRRLVRRDSTAPALLASVAADVLSKLAVAPRGKGSKRSHSSESDAGSVAAEYTADATQPGSTVSIQADASLSIDPAALLLLECAGNIAEESLGSWKRSRPSSPAHTDDL